MRAIHMCAIMGWLLIVLTMGDAFAQEITVTHSVICREIVDQAPGDVGDVFHVGTERLFCFSQIDGAIGEIEVTHNWYYQGNLKASVALPVRSSSWRTWSSKAIRPDWAGEWMVEILRQDGTPLESLTFSIQ